MNGDGNSEYEVETREGGQPQYKTSDPLEYESYLYIGIYV